jgi:multiple sugar transport system permease protein
MLPRTQSGVFTGDNPISSIPSKMPSDENNSASAIIAVSSNDLEAKEGKGSQRGSPFAMLGFPGVKLRLLHRGLTSLFLTVFACLVLIPFGYMTLMSFKRPAEFGDGNVLPRGFVSFLQPREGSVLLFRGNIDGELAAALGTKSAGLRVSAEDPPSHSAARSQSANLVLIEKGGLASKTFQILLEVSDPYGHIEKAVSLDPRATLYIPTDAGMAKTEIQWEPHPHWALLGVLFSNYKTLLEIHRLQAGQWITWFSTGYPRWFLNSLLVAGVAVILGVFLDSLAAFAFAKYRFPGKKLLFLVLLGTLMVPYPVTLVPTFFIYANMGLYNTYAALIIPGMASAFGIFLVRQYVQGIPDEFLDAARVDGAGEFHLFLTIILPMARPVLAALCVFRFIFQWNSYLFPLVFTNSDSMKTLQLGLATMEDPHGSVDYGLLMAGATLAVVPVVILYTMMQKHFISGLTMGGVKG